LAGKNALKNVQEGRFVSLSPTPKEDLPQTGALAKLTYGNLGVTISGD